MSFLRFFQTALGLTALCNAFGCSAGRTQGAFCQQDADCPASEVCFQDGCGDPGDEVVVEVTPQGQTSTPSQELVLGRLEATQDLVLTGEPRIEGDAKIDGNNPSAELGTALTFSGLGKSIHIPGLERRFRAKVPLTNGHYQLPISTGDYTVTVWPADVNIPPFVQQVEVGAGGHLAVNPLFTRAESRSRFEAQLVSSGSPVKAEGLMVQAFKTSDPDVSLSQRVPVPTDGSVFALTLPAENKQAQDFSLAVTNSSPDTVLIPQKAFSVLGAMAPLKLELGNFGPAFNVTGFIIGPGGKPVVDATVHLEGEVEGGGAFRSPSVRTSDNGSFSLKTLAARSADASSLTLWVVPRVGESAGLTAIPVPVVASSALLPIVTCPRRIQVHGKVMLPKNAGPAVGASVEAQPIAKVEGAPMPTQSASALTDVTGSFTLELDPASYRLDIQTLTALPRTSVFQTVEASSPGASTELTLPNILLAEGRTVQGRVMLRESESEPSVPAPRAALRFFRRERFGAGSAARPLAEAMTDESGNYSVRVPTQ